MTPARALELLSGRVWRDSSLEFELKRARGGARPVPGRVPTSRTREPTSRLIGHREGRKAGQGALAEIKPLLHGNGKFE